MTLEFNLFSLSSSKMASPLVAARGVTVWKFLATQALTYEKYQNHWMAPAYNEDRQLRHLRPIDSVGIQELRGVQRSANRSAAVPRRCVHFSVAGVSIVRVPRETS